MTLADFARSIGISPSTARQWKKRGKIVERDGSIELLADVQKRDSLIGAEVCGGSGVTGKVITAARDGFTVQCDSGASVTPIAVTACECGSLACAICSPGRDDTATMPVPRPRGISPLGLCDEDDPRRFEPVTDSAQDSHGREGADLPPESNRGSCAEYCRDCGAWIESESDWPICKGCHAKNPRVECADAEAVRKWVLSGENFTIDELCTMRSQIEALQRDNEKLKKDVRALYEDSAEHEKRLQVLEGDPTLRSLVQLYKADAELQRSIESLGKPKNGVIDPPGPNWGA